MRAVFTSVTRLFRRPSFLTAARSHPTTTTSSSSSSSSSPTSTRSRSRKGRSKSRHELISDAHIAYMQQASTFSSSSSYSSSSSLSLPLSSPWMESSNGPCNEGEVSSSSSRRHSRACATNCAEWRIQCPSISTNQITSATNGLPPPHPPTVIQLIHTTLHSRVGTRGLGLARRLAQLGVL
jgi:hypothetical protein